MQVQFPDIQTPMSAQGIQARPYYRQGILRQIDQGRSLGLYRKSPQTRRSRGDAHRHVQPQPGLAALRRATDDAHGRLTPQLIDKPGFVLGPYLQLRGLLDGQYLRGYGHNSCLAAVICSAPTVSQSATWASSNAFSAR